MDVYVSKVRLVVNGEEITDFSGLTEGKYDLRKEVPLMNGTGVTRLNKRYPLSVDYVVPQDKPEFDFDSIENGTLIVEHENGESTTYTGVSTLSVGDTKYDADNAATRTIELLASGRD